MNIQLKRFNFQNKCTIGHLWIDGVDTGLFTLEDKDREVPGVMVSAWKILGKTAIPRGNYKIIVTFSEHFQRRLPLLLGVPGFEGVRIHSGNIDADTHGCILVGKIWKGTDWIGQSREAFNDLFPKIAEADNVAIEII